MLKKTRFVCLFLGSSVALFSQNNQKESEKAFLAQVNASHKVIAHAPNAIQSYGEGKLYIDEGQIYETNVGPFLALQNGEILFIPHMPNDSIGSYLSTLSKSNDKIFKNVCNKCHYEWIGGVFDIWCPNCGSTDWETVRDRN